MNPPDAVRGANRATDSTPRGTKRGGGTLLACSLLVLLALLVAIAWAVTERDVRSGLRELLAQRWGVVTLLDLGVGLLFVAAWMFALERNKLHWLLWVLGLLLLGNVVTCVYLIRRARRAPDWRTALLGNESARR